MDASLARLVLPVPSVARCGDSGGSFCSKGSAVKSSSIFVYLPAEGGPMRRLTDFGERSVLIARRIAWAPGSRHIYAAVAETDADVVSLVGLL